MSGPGQEMIELFLQEASEHLQFLREYSGILQDSYPLQDDIERLYISAHGLAGTAGTYGYKLFSEVASKLAHIFQYAMNATIAPDATAPLVEFIYEAIAVLESDLLMVSQNSVEAEEDIAEFKQRYPFAFQAPPQQEEEQVSEPEGAEPEIEAVQTVETPQPQPASPAVSSAAAPAPIEKPESAVAPQPSARDVQPATPPQPVSSEPAVPTATVKTATEKPAPVPSASPVATTASSTPVPPVAAAKPAVSAAETSKPQPTKPAAGTTTAPAPGKPAAAQPAPEISALQAKLVPAASTKPAPAPPTQSAPAAPKPAPVVDTKTALAEQPKTVAAVAVAPPSPVTSVPASPAPVAPPKHVPSVKELAAKLPDIEPDGELPEEILEFFIPEVEEHLQTVTECLLALEANPNAEDINRLFRAMHTIKGSAAQVGVQRISTVAHRAEDLIGKLRDGELAPSARIVDLCLETVDVLKKLVYRQWEDDASFQVAAKTLIVQIDRMVSPEPVEPEAEEPAPAVDTPRAEVKTATAESATILPVSVVEDAQAPKQESPLRPEEGTQEAAPVPVPIAQAAVAVADVAVPAAESVPSSRAEDVIAEEVPALAAEPEPPVSEPALATVERLPVSQDPDDILQLDEEPAPVAAPQVETKESESSPVASVPAPDVSLEPDAAPVLDIPQPEAPALIIPDAAAAMHIAPAVFHSLPQPDGKEGKQEESEALAKSEPTSIPQSKSVRIALQRLDRMMNAVGELVINRTRMLGRLAELAKLADVLNFSKGRMSDKIAEFQEKYEFSRISVNPRPQAAEPVWGNWQGDSLPYRGGYSSYARGFDPSLAEFSELEMDRYDDFGILSRSLTEISADITEVLTQLDGFVRRVDSDIDEFTKLAHRLQDEITQARMVPIGNLYTRISRTARDAAKAAGKQVELTLAGAETELDNNIIQQIADPLLHLVRNAVAHGIERSEERYELGKPDAGNVAVRAYHRGNHIYIEVEDDGRGIDYERVRTSAIDGGFVSREHAERLTERELMDLLFRPGFSTAPRKTELAGRGVGLDVVRSNLTSLNGEIDIETVKDIGTRFTMKVPLTLIISQALFVRCGTQVFAFPLAFVEEIRRIKDADIQEVGGKLMTKVREVTTEVVRLDSQLGLPPIQPIAGWYRLVIVNVAGRQVGIVVEEVLRKDEIVIKNLGEYLRNVKIFPGATIAPDGSLILLVDINRLIMGEAIERHPIIAPSNAARLFAPGATAVAAGTIPAAAIDEVETEKVIVLADDSISVRKFVGRMLEKAGYRVKLAADGLEALELAAQFKCDLVITDLEMPRTNGYELMLHLRQGAETRGIPVMVVTSRAGEKHRDRAMKEGAAAFMVKPVQEENLVAQVAKLIGKSVTVQ